jgi:DNA-binding XRE family transcriptional regulator
MMPKPPLDFAKVEALRKHMLLTTTDMSELLGVSRMTYYGWVKGKTLRKTNDESVRTMLRKLLAVMTEHGWPMPEVIAADQKQRKERLDAILNSEN